MRFNQLGFDSDEISNRMTSLPRQLQNDNYDNNNSKQITIMVLLLNNQNV